MQSGQLHPPTHPPTRPPSHPLPCAVWRRYMSIATALQQLLEVEAARQGGAYSASTTCVGVSRLGAQDQQIAVGTMEQLQQVDFGPPLHSLVIAGGWGARCLGGSVGGGGAPRGDGATCLKHVLIAGCLVCCHHMPRR
jgi:hypothetical protein